MDVPVTELRAHLSDWLERARAGEEIIVTDRGVPVVRILGVTATATIQRLTAEGVIGRPASANRPIASERNLIRVSKPVSDYVTEQREDRPY